MNLHITKSKNAESFYITKSYINEQGKSTSTVIRKLGTLAVNAPDWKRHKSFWNHQRISSMMYTGR